MTALCSVPDCSRHVGSAQDAAVIACPGDVAEAPTVYCLECSRRSMGHDAFLVPSEWFVRTAGCGE